MQYDTGGDFYEKIGKNFTKIKIILTHWSVSDPGSNDEKKLEVKNLVGMFF